ncbi:uncharacterized protein WM277_024386 isoform 1-T2 [Molossus nigricans]
MALKTKVWVLDVLTGLLSGQRQEMCLRTIVGFLNLIHTPKELSLKLSMCPRCDLVSFWEMDAECCTEGLSSLHLKRDFLKYVTYSLYELGHLSLESSKAAAV